MRGRRGMKKVLILQNSIAKYRVDVFNNLAKEVDLTVLFSEGEKPKGCLFQTIKIKTISLHYKFHMCNLYKIAKQFDVVICPTDISNLQYRLLYLLPHNYKLIFWGIGVGASYECRYDADIKIANLIMKLTKIGDATLFYTDYPVAKYAARGVEKEKMFVAHNTVKVKDIPVKEKHTILFVGSLYKQKKVDILIEQYIKASNADNSVPELLIIGDGDAKLELQKQIKESNMESKIHLVGSIYDEDVLAEYFTEALVCISPDQAGLSVLKSMGYGVPFVTHKKAITGGEIFNIHTGVDGVLFEDFNEIKEVILDCSINPEKYVEMGREAKKYYYANRTIDVMVRGFIDAIEYVTKNESKEK